MAFGGRIGGRLQKTTSPRRAGNGPWLGPISARATARLAPVPRSGNARAQRVRKRVRPWPRAQVGPGVNYARRQQYRRLARAGKAGLGGVAAVLLGLAAGGAGAAALGGLLLLTAAGLGLYALHWLSLARRSRVGARSEDAVQRALAPLQAEGWRLRHSLSWQGRGDIDSVAIAPTGVGIVIETKTRTYNGRHLARVHEQAVWMSRCRRRWFRGGALAVLCLVRVRGVRRCERGVLVVSIDRLTPTLRIAAGVAPSVVQSSC
jgi:Nuclease-related domain